MKYVLIIDIDQLSSKQVENLVKDPATEFIAKIENKKFPSMVKAIEHEQDYQ